MAVLFDTGAIAGLVLAVMAVEALILLRFRRKAATAPSVRAILLALAPGACLVAALGASLRDAAWPWVAVWLTAAFVFHLLDLRERWSEAARRR